MPDSDPNSAGRSTPSSQASTTPTIFISYSYDSDAHRDWVRGLAERLRRGGIHVRLDQWELRPGYDLAEFMESAIRDSGYVLLICTEEFARKANIGAGGVGYEKAVITGELLAKRPDIRGKFVPVLRRGSPSTAKPSYAQTLIHVDMRKESDFEAGAEEILRHVYDEPVHRPPPIGPKPNFDLGAGLSGVKADEVTAVLAEHRSPGGSLAAKPSPRPWIILSAVIAAAALLAVPVLWQSQKSISEHLPDAHVGNSSDRAAPAILDPASAEVLSPLSADASFADAISIADTSISPKLRLHVYVRDDEARAGVERLRSLIESKIGISEVSVAPNLPNVSQVRYMKENDRNDAVSLVNFLRSHGISVVVRHVSGYEDRVRTPGYFELWLAKSWTVPITFGDELGLPRGAFSVHFQFYPSTAEAAARVRTVTDSLGIHVEDYRSVPEGKLRPRNSEIIYFGPPANEMAKVIQIELRNRYDIDIPLAKSEYYGDPKSSHKLRVNVF